ncbi:hypothetical protein BpHYR1_044620 [Brachionus plicatilis]|uniref:Uncharacterized protein n=1 Tax=Brachionus plicatilis TaxID=10195 RepID=A0A3M7RV26_BRAPC|nr:hypothetical protein BpHYR1_044620 [Brachionus plicatilis]
MATKSEGLVWIPLARVEAVFPIRPSRVESARLCCHGDRRLMMLAMTSAIFPHMNKIAVVAIKDWVKFSLNVCAKKEFPWDGIP